MSGNSRENKLSKLATPSDIEEIEGLNLKDLTEKRSARVHAFTHASVRAQQEIGEYAARVTISGRVSIPIASALRRAYMEHRAQGKQPATRDGIIAEALADWLKKHNYLMS
jgi:hypothetical protein